MGVGEGQIVAWAEEVVVASETKQENGERSRREQKPYMECANL